MNWWVRLIRWAAFHPQFIAYLLVAGAFATGIWRVETIARDAKRSTVEQCEALDQFARSLGDELGATSERVDRFIERLHDDLEHC